MATETATDTAAWQAVHIARNSRVMVCGYHVAYLPSALDSAYLAFTAGNLSGDVDAMRTAARLIGGRA